MGPASDFGITLNLLLLNEIFCMCSQECLCRMWRLPSTIGSAITTPKTLIPLKMWFTVSFLLWNNKQITSNLLLSQGDIPFLQLITFEFIADYWYSGLYMAYKIYFEIYSEIKFFNLPCRPYRSVFHILTDSVPPTIMKNIITMNYHCHVTLSYEI